MSHMRRALTLARRALGSVSPNPAVGAVVVKDGVVVGEGQTQPPGKDHAEIVALRVAGHAARGAVLYTTLEPCVHHSKTPPCTQAIICAGVTEVRASTTDPNPIVCGKGFDALKNSGITVVVGEEADNAAKVIEGYSKYITTGSPFITAKFAVSLDGKIATRSGYSKWITSERSRWFTHRLRSESDAILTGVNTVIVDDPLLTARDQRGVPRKTQPTRVVLDTSSRIPEDSKLLKQPGKTIIASANVDQDKRDKLAKHGVQFLIVPSTGGRVDIIRLLHTLGREEGITNMLVEGGATIMGTLFDLSLVDKVVAFIAPTVIGGKDAPSPVAGTGVETIAEALKLQRVQWKRFGRDVAVTGYC